MWSSNYDQSTDMYQHFTKLNKARSAIGQASASFYTTKATVASSSEHEIAVVKTPMLSVLSNRGANSGSVSMNVPNLSYAANTQLLDIVSCQTVSTKSDKSLDVVIQNGAPRVYVPASYNNGNALCLSTTEGGGSKQGGGIVVAQIPLFMGGMLTMMAGIALVAF
jgi:alpha-amylase